MLTTVRRLSSNLMSGRFCGRTQVPNHCENRLILENYFSEQIKQKFGFNDEESKRATLLCSKAFEESLSSREEITRVVDFVCKHFQSKDVSHNPQIFLLNYKTIRNRVTLLQEMGFSRPTVASSESLFKSLLKNKSIEELMKVGFCSKHPIDHVINTCPLKYYVRKELRRCVKNDIKPDMNIESARRLLVTHFLIIRMGVDLDSAQKISKRPDIVRTPFETIVRNADLVIDFCKMPVNCVVKSPLLLTIDTQNAQKILANIETIGGQSIVSICRKYPKLLDTKFETLKENLDLILRDFTSEQLLKAVPVLTLNPRAVEDRIRTFKTNKDLEPLHKSPRGLRVVLQMNSVMRKLELLSGHMSGQKEWTVAQLCAEYLPQVSEVICFSTFVSKNFGLNAREVRALSGCHPKVRRFDLENAEHVMQWLRLKRVTERQLKVGPHLVLYDWRTVRDTWESCDPQWLEDDNCLQYILYSIESQFGFSGNGVFVSGTDV